MEPAIVRASNEAIVRRDGDGEKVGIGREGGERIPGFEVPELERLVGGSGQRAAAIRQRRYRHTSPSVGPRRKRAISKALSRYWKLDAASSESATTITPRRRLRATSAGPRHRRVSLRRYHAQRYIIRPRNHRGDNCTVLPCHREGNGKMAAR